MKGLSVLSKKAKATRILAMSVAVATGLALIAGAGWALFGLPAVTHADGPDKADIVVQFDDQDAVVRNVTFTGPITGVKALEESGLNIETYDAGWGIAVCSIEDVGCPATDCFCDTNNFWGYNYWDGSAWQGYMVGASVATITNGAIEGWRWGPWRSAMVPAPQMTATTRALDWLRTQQQPDGGYGSVGSSVETMLAIGADGYRAAEWRAAGGSDSLAGYVLKNGASFANSSPAASGKLAVAIAATGGEWPASAMKPMAYYSPTLGAYSVDSLTNAWAILGTLAMGQPAPAPAVDALKNAMQSNGGWEWAVGWGTDTNSTSLALQALVAAGEPLTSTAVVSGLNYLKSAQNADGGFTYDPVSSWGTASDTNSTAYVLQALQATLQPAPVVGTGNFGSFVMTGTTPISYLLGMQLANGSFEWQSGLGENLLATQQAVPALLGKPFPLVIRQISDGDAVPNSGGVITPTAGVTVSVSSGAFTDTVQMYFTSLASAGVVAPGNIGVFYELDALYGSSGQPAQLQPGQTYTITVTYDEANLPPGFDETRLALYYWNNGQWMKEPTSAVDTVANTITATPNHFSLWSALAVHEIYLPVVFK